MTALQASLDATTEPLERLRIQQVLDEWVFCRDNGEWAALRDHFAVAGRMTTNGASFTADEFVGYGRAARERGTLSHHITGPSRIRIVGTRATAETQATLRLRNRVHDVEVDVTAQVRYVDRLVLEDARWRILHRQPLYLLDRMDPVRPDAKLTLNDELLARCPEGARFLIYLRLATGAPAPDPAPVTFNTPEADSILSAAESWLHETKSAPIPADLV
jgi:hypothetical protein